VLCSHTAVEARAIAERVRGALAARTATSVGVAQLGPHGAGFTELYAHADAELYREKMYTRR
jgi:GGDEF domain-containing protein